MFINNFSKREKLLALITISIVSIGVLYAAIIGPLASGLKNLNSQTQSKVDLLENDFKILTNQKTIESEYAKLSKYAKIGQNEEQAVADALAYIENVSRNDACLITNIKPIDVKGEASYKEILIDVSAEATIEQFSKFLYDIENPRDTLVNVKRFTLSAKSGQSGALKGTFIISKILLN